VKTGEQVEPANDFDKLCFFDVLQFANFDPKLVLNQPTTSACALEGLNEGTDGMTMLTSTLTSLGSSPCYHPSRANIARTVR
jgi:hypothetical protein